MQLKNYPFDKLPFSELFRSYINDFSELQEFYTANPFNEEALHELASNICKSDDREATIELLKKFNNRFDLHQAALDNIERLGDKRSLALVTGQQLGIFGGPLYTVFKTVTTIHLSAVLEKSLDRPVVPIFWLADEDHDYDEVKKVHLLDGDELLTYSLDHEQSSNPPVADITLMVYLKSFAKI
ncbi:MAG: bacillithiol biosynthesis BshC [Balneolaceae bacterium]|nr:bacillithiol biosynthesis BshC [Balneolaceae bacterium]